MGNTNEEELYEEIDDYLKGRLSEEEGNLFERKMNNDPELLQSVKFYNFLINGLQTQAIKKEVDAYILKRNRKKNFLKKVISSIFKKRSNPQNPFTSKQNENSVDLEP